MSRAQRGRRRPSAPHHLLVVLAFALVGPLLASVVPATARPAGAATVQETPAYRPPVDAPVIDSFRAPTTPYGPGNRGLQYGTAAGLPVRAAADGRVTFAGSVAGSLHVTVLHADGLRTTVSFLATVEVVVGQVVRQGDRLGTTSGPLHFSARRGDAYLDPAALFVPGPPHVHLVRFDVPPGPGAGGERSAIRQLLGGIGHVASGAVRGAAHLTGATAAWVRDRSPELLRLALHYAPAVLPVLATLDEAVAAVQLLRTAWDLSHRPCTPRGVAPPAPAGRRVAVLVAGLGSTSRHASVDEVDTAGLGYAPPDVVRFSYRGGRVPGTGVSTPSAPSHPYKAAATQQDLLLSGRRLADLVDAVVLDHPGVPVDLVAHSLGGLVTRLAVLELERRHGTAWLDRIGLLATIGTPHGGADLATGIEAISTTGVGRGTLGVLGSVVDPGLDPGSIGVEQLSETSDVIALLRAHPVPAGLHAVSIAARGDLIVPVPRARVAGAPEVVVPLLGPTAHDRLPGSPAVTRELALARAGAPPTCTGFGQALADQVVGEAISRTETGAAVALWGGFAGLEILGPVVPDAVSPDEP